MGVAGISKDDLETLNGSQTIKLTGYAYIDTRTIQLYMSVAYICVYMYFEN